MTTERAPPTGVALAEAQPRRRRGGHLPSAAATGRQASVPTSRRPAGRRPNPLSHFAAGLHVRLESNVGRAACDGSSWSHW